MNQGKKREAGSEDTHKYRAITGCPGVQLSTQTKFKFPEPYNNPRQV